ncbi:MAG TPA: hypothetical protein VFU11_11300, partial [Solirubrobacterales bacterium]|nr:hypothetical protein [Solirubrobacterales bacterium]
MIVRAGGAQRALAAVGLLISFVLVALSGGTAAASGVWVDRSSPEDAASFWTTARMRAAKPL